MLEKLEDKFSKYEIARILGARALQLSMDAPLLLKISEKELEEINFNPLKIAEKELESEVLPITIKKPFPEKGDGELKIKKTEVEEKPIKIKEKEEELSDEKIEEKEAEEEAEIEKAGEIMELAKPEDEREEEITEKEI